MSSNLVRILIIPPKLRGSLDSRASLWLTEQQLRTRPHGLNSIAWLMWHIAWCEDVVANTILNRRPQVFDLDAWPGRLNISRRDIGTEMTGDEVTELCTAVHIPSLRAYRIAVGKHTREWIQSLSARGLEDAIPEAGVRRAVAEGTLSQKARWAEDIWLNRPQPWFLYWEIIWTQLFPLGAGSLGQEARENGTKLRGIERRARPTRLAWGDSWQTETKRGQNPGCPNSKNSPYRKYRRVVSTRIETRAIISSPACRVRSYIRLDRRAPRRDYAAHAARAR